MLESSVYTSVNRMARPIALPSDFERLLCACRTAAAKQQHSTVTGESLYQSIFASVGNRMLSVRGINTRIRMLEAGLVDSAVHVLDASEVPAVVDPVVSRSDTTGPSVASVATVQGPPTFEASLKRRMSFYDHAEKRQRLLLSALEEDSDTANKRGGAQGVMGFADPDRLLPNDKDQLYALCLQKVCCLYVLWRYVTSRMWSVAWYVVVWCAVPVMWCGSVDTPGWYFTWSTEHGCFVACLRERTLLNWRRRLETPTKNSCRRPTACGYGKSVCIRRRLQ